MHHRWLYLVLATVCFGVSARAQSLSDYNAGVERLTAIFRAHVFVLNRPLVTFHYEQPDPKWNPQSLADVKTRVLDWPDRFYNADIQGEYEQGAGTYVAIDPAASRSFSNADPRLFVITLKTGTRLLKVSGSESLDETHAFQELYQQFHCQNESNISKPPKILLAHLIELFRNSSNMSCRRLAIGAARRAGIDAILYSYVASTSLATCRARDESLNVIRASAIEASKISYYSRAHKWEGVPMLSYLARLYPEALTDFGLRFALDPNQISAAQGEANEPAPYPLYRAWKKLKLYKCGGIWSSETPGDTNDPTQIIRPSLADEQIATLLFQARDLYERRFYEDHSIRFDPNRLQAVESAELKLSGLSMPTSAFAELLDRIAYPRDDDDGSATEALLQESGRWQTAILNQIAQLRPQAQESQRPNWLWIAMVRAGAGPKLAWLNFNRMILGQIGGAPYLISLPGADLDERANQNYDLNRNYFKQILKDCIRLYSDPNTSFEQIQSGACGVRK